MVETRAPHIATEEKLREKGLNVIIVDHHYYNEIDRRQDLSSLEQIMELVNWPANQVDMAIAVNDRSYIPGLKEMGLSEEEIRKVRKFDLILDLRLKSRELILIGRLCPLQ